MKFKEFLKKIKSPGNLESDFIYDFINDVKNDNIYTPDELESYLCNLGASTDAINVGMELIYKFHSEINGEYISWLFLTKPNFKKEDLYKILRKNLNLYIKLSGITKSGNYPNYYTQNAYDFIIKRGVKSASLITSVSKEYRDKISEILK